MAKTTVSEAVEETLPRSCAKPKTGQLSRMAKAGVNKWRLRYSSHAKSLASKVRILRIRQGAIVDELCADDGVLARLVRRRARILHRVA